MSFDIPYSPSEPTFAANDDSEKRGISLSKDIAMAQNDPNLHDITFICKDGTKIAANKALLAMRSKYFYAMFFGTMLEATATEVSLGDTSQKQLSAVIDFCYTDKIPSLSLDTAAEFHRAADYFQLEGMRDLVAEHIKRNLGGTLKDRDAAINMLCHAVDQKQLDFISGPIIQILRKCILSHRVGKEQLKLFTAEALEALLSDKDVTRHCPTRAFRLFVAVVEWAWESIEAIGEPLQTDQQAFFAWLNMTDIQAKSSAIYLPLKESDRKRLAERLNPIARHLEFKNICPHRLAVIMDALPFLPLDVLCQAFRIHSLRSRHLEEWCVGNTLVWCPARFNAGVSFRDDNSTAEYPESNNIGVRLIHTNSLPPTGTYEYTIAIRNIGINQSNDVMNTPKFAVGLVSRSKIGDGTATVGTFTASFGYQSSGLTYQNGQRFNQTSSPFTAGALIKFSLNRESRNCTISLGGERQAYWVSLQEDVVPAVSLTPGSVCEIW